MRVLCPVVLSQSSRSMTILQTQFGQRRGVGAEAIGSDRRRLNRLIPEQPLQQIQGCPCIPPTLDHQVQNLALIVNRAPELHLPAADPHDHLVEMPLVARSRPLAVQILCDLGAKLDILPNTITANPTYSTITTPIAR